MSEWEFLLLRYSTVGIICIVKNLTEFTVFLNKIKCLSNRKKNNVLHKLEKMN